MFGLFLVAALCAHSAAPTAQGAVDAAVKQGRALLDKQFNKPADEIRALDRKIMDLAPSVTRWGWRAVDPLSRALADRSQPVKLRLFLVSFLSLTRDPLAAAPLARLLRDPAEPPLIRTEAAQSLGGLPLPATARRRALCPVLAQADLPSAVLRQTLMEVQALGCDDASGLDAALRRLGHKPRGLEADDTRRALLALGASLPLESRRRLLELASFYPPDSAEEAVLFEALGRRPEDLAAVRPQAEPVVWRALRDADLSPRAREAALPLLAALAPEGAVEHLLKALEHPDAGVVAAAAEGLAALSYEPARERLRAIVDGVASDRRFGPRADGREPGALLTRIQKAEQVLKPR